MSVQAAMGAASALVALAFALSTWERWVTRGRRHDLAWATSLFMFVLGASALWAGAALGWEPWSFRAFYLFGAILNVPFLALGSVYLLGTNRAGDAAGAALALLGSFAVGVLATTPLTGEIDPGVLPRGSEVFGLLPRLMAALASGGGATVVLAGTLWSIWRMRHSGPSSGRLVAANALIALGVIVLAGGGLLNSVVNEMTAFGASLLVGVVFLFAGFLIAGSTKRSGEGYETHQGKARVILLASLERARISEALASAPSPSRHAGARRRS